MGIREVPPRRSILHLLLVCVLLLLSPFALSGQASKPITREGLEKALQLGGLKSGELVGIIKQRGVDFLLDAATETKLRSLGATPAIIDAVAQTYRGASQPVIDPSLLNIWKPGSHHDPMTDKTDQFISEETHASPAGDFRLTLVCADEVGLLIKVDSINQKSQFVCEESRLRADAAVFQSDSLGCFVDKDGTGYSYTFMGKKQVADGDKGLPMTTILNANAIKLEALYKDGRTTYIDFSTKDQAFREYAARSCAPLAPVPARATITPPPAPAPTSATRTPTPSARSTWHPTDGMNKGISERAMTREHFATGSAASFAAALPTLVAEALVANGLPPHSVDPAISLSQRFVTLCSTPAGAKNAICSSFPVGKHWWTDNPQDRSRHLGLAIRSDQDDPNVMYVNLYLSPLPNDDDNPNIAVSGYLLLAARLTKK